MVAPPEIIQSAEAPAPILQLLWLEPGGTDRLWDDPALTELLEGLAEAPKDEPAHAYARSVGLPPEAYREALAVLAQAEPLDEAAMVAALARATGRGGPVVVPLVVAGGEIERALEPRDVQTAAKAVAAALPADDEVGTEGLDREVAHSLLVAGQTQSRELFGADHLRVLLHAEGSPYPLVAYLPKAAADHLPLMARMPVRALAEVHPPQDPDDPGPVALRIRALARLASKPSWGS